MHRVRVLLLLDVVAAALVGAVVLFGVGAPLAASGRLRLAALAMLAAMGGAAGIWVGWSLLVRSVARPVERLLAAARGLATPHDALPVLSPVDEPGSLGVVAIAFERVAGALLEERARLAAKIAELERTNHELAEARESWVRSERLAAVGRIGAGLAHEVGNPLGAITGYVELARSRVPPDADPELRGSLDRIGAAAERIDATLRGLLEFARPSPPALAGVEVPAVVDAVLRLARVQ
ncbi:MAG TPA: histidine kinase dimerization/phospho-acceptor domain-containing protein, partial [Longimicrobiales bacterium]